MGVGEKRFDDLRDEARPLRIRELPLALTVRLRDGYDAGVLAHGTLPLTFEVYGMRVLGLARRRLRRAGLAPTEDCLAEALDRSVLPDLYLSTACEENLPQAWEAFLSRYTPLARAVARRQGAAPDQVEVLASELGGTLLLPPARGGFRTRLGTFDGSGSLVAWIAAVVAHRLSDLRGAHRGLSLDELLREQEAGSRRPVPVAADPEDPADVAAGRESADLFGEGLRLAWDGLTLRERSVLVWKYRDGLSQVEIARRIGVGTPRVSRIVGAAHGKLRDALDRGFPGSDRPGVERRIWRAMRDAAGIHLATSVLPTDTAVEDPAAGA